MQVEVYIRPDAARCYHASASKLFGAEASKHRLSHIEPCNFWLRRIFRFCRRFGDETRLADWTRTWACRWQVDFAPMGGGLHRVDAGGRPFASRKAALDFEAAIVSLLVASLYPSALGDKDVSADT